MIRLIVLSLGVNLYKSASLPRSRSRIIDIDLFTRSMLSVSSPTDFCNLVFSRSKSAICVWEALAFCFNRDNWLNKFLLSLDFCLAIALYCWICFFISLWLFCCFCICLSRFAALTPDVMQNKRIITAVINFLIAHTPLTLQILYRVCRRSVYSHFKMKMISRRVSCLTYPRYYTSSLHHLPLLYQAR